ncbi:MAG: hypothetical protein ACFB15_06550 [Cyclobacteriaceae bacterium]
MTNSTHGSHRQSFLSRCLYFSVILGLLIGLVQCKPTASSNLQIDVWYGSEQYFGKRGTPQQWVNILGNVQPVAEVQSLQYSLNGQSFLTLSLGEDGRRLANSGDFNVELHIDSLRVGKNEVVITAADSAGMQISETISVHLDRGSQWPLPYAIDWDTVQQISDVVQIVDGKWELADGGVKTTEPYYDRVLAFGDASWQDYEVTTSVIFHDFTVPRPGPPTFNVSHAAIASRWPGHDTDGKQPNVKWFPLGATAEFRLTGNLDSCRWRVFDGEHLYVEDTSKIRKINLGTKYHMKHRVFTVHDSLTRYQVKLWEDGQAEPTDWDLVADEYTTENIESGSALLLAHNTDVTFGPFSVIPIADE